MAFEQAEHLHLRILVSSAGSGVCGCMVTLLVAYAEERGRGREGFFENLSQKFLHVSGK